MSTSCGAAGAFGILLSDVTEIEGIYNKFKGEVLVLVTEGDDIETLIRDKDEELEEILTKYQSQFSALLHSVHGLSVPSAATLKYTGIEDDRPADGGTPAEEWVLGFGIYTKPWEYPEMLDTFRTAADYHTWVWVG
jgi:hypothetical protein